MSENDLKAGMAVLRDIQAWRVRILKQVRPSERPKTQSWERVVDRRVEVPGVAYTLIMAAPAIYSDGIIHLETEGGTKNDH